MMRAIRGLTIALALMTAIAGPAAAATKHDRDSGRDATQAATLTAAALPVTTFRVPATLGCSVAYSFKTLTARYVTATSSPSQLIYQRMHLWRSYDGRNWTELWIIKPAGSEWLFQQATSTPNATWRLLTTGASTSAVTDVVVDYGRTYYIVGYELLLADGRSGLLWGPSVYC